MTNEEIISIKQEEYLMRLMPTQIEFIKELMDAARKDEAIAFGNLLKNFTTIEHIRNQILWWDKIVGGLYYSTEQLYELFKKKKWIE